jgi:hypothetical protein
MKFTVMSITAEEAAKMERGDYVPEEYVSGYVEADSEPKAQRELRAGIRTGMYPRNSELSAIVKD